jgi:hypothetical protein
VYGLGASVLIDDKPGLVPRCSPTRQMDCNEAWRARLLKWARKSRGRMNQARSIPSTRHREARSGGREFGTCSRRLIHPMKTMTKVPQIVVAKTTEKTMSVIMEPLPLG